MSDHTNNLTQDVIDSYRAGFALRLYVTQEPAQAQARIDDAVKALAKLSKKPPKIMAWNRLCGFFFPAPDLLPSEPNNQIEVALNIMLKGADEIANMHKALELPKSIEPGFEPADNFIFVIHEADAIIGGERGGNGKIITLLRSYMQCNMSTTQYTEGGGTDSDGNRGVVRGRRMLVFLSNGGDISQYMPEIKPVHVALPNADALREAAKRVFDPLDEQYKADKKKGCKLPADDVFSAIITSTTGMTTQDAEDSISRAWQQTGTLNDVDKFLEVIETEKARVIKGIPGLSYMPKSTLPGRVLPGYESVESILSEYLNVPADEAMKRNLPRLKGFLLVGSPGCGKTETAKIISRVTRRFALSLSLGEIQQGVVGASEAAMRRAMEVIRAIKAVVLVDEIDKMGVNVADSGHTGDGGTFGRLIGMLHTEMTDPANEAIFLLTANNLVGPQGQPIIPGSLIRAGRIDERFFVNPPDRPIREAIFGVRAKLHGMDFDSDKNIAELAQRTDKWVGAEIANLVQRGVRSALSRGKKQIDTGSMIAYAGTFTPLLAQQAFAESFERQVKACAEFTQVGRSTEANKAASKSNTARSNREQG